MKIKMVCAICVGTKKSGFELCKECAFEFFVFHLNKEHNISKSKEEMYGYYQKWEEAQENGSLIEGEKNEKRNDLLW